MSGNFRPAYAALAEFIANHPEIEIGTSVISIPEGVRTAFYDRFNAVRDAFVEGKFPTYLRKAESLLENYRRAQEKAAGLLSFEEPPMVSRLQRFTADPKGSLTRELFDPLFDLLKGKESLEGFEKYASGRIEELFPGVFQGGYEKWAVLSLVALLAADKAFRVNVRNLGPGERAKSASNAPLEEVPSPEESTSFYFDQPRNAIFAVPDFIIHASRLDRFVGIRSEFREGLYNAMNPCPEREWYPVDTDLLILLERGLTLVYAAEQAENIALVADVGRFCRPDLVLWCVDTQSVTRKEALEAMKHADSRLRPLKGSYIIANNPWPESAEENLQAQTGGLTESIHQLTVGYDESKLNPVAEALINETGPAITT